MCLYQSWPTSRKVFSLIYKVFVLFMNLNSGQIVKNIKKALSNHSCNFCVTASKCINNYCKYIVHCTGPVSFSLKGPMTICLKNMCRCSFNSESSLPKRSRTSWEKKTVGRTLFDILAGRVGKKSSALTYVLYVCSDIQKVFFILLRRGT